MDLQRLSLYNFRNFTRVESITLQPGALLVAAAPNAAGKTNFLESIVVLFRGRSWRGRLEQCARWNTDVFRVEGDVALQQGLQQLSVSYNRSSRAVKIEENAHPVSLVTLYARYPLLTFLPEDSFLFSRGPEARRNFLNHVLISSEAYVTSFVQYQRSLRQRNSALKTARTHEEIAPWTSLLTRHAEEVWRLRSVFILFLQTHLNNLYGELSGESRRFSVRLSATYSAAELSRRLEQSFSSEQRLGYTALGPHRDDMEIETDGYPVQAVLSRGQTRSLVLALKIAAYRFLKHITAEEPLVLLDDVFSELDEQRQRALVEHLPQSQVLLTCTRIPAIVRQKSSVYMLDLRAIASGGAARVSEKPAAQRVAVAA